MTVETKFGNVGISDDGYYRIYSKKEGNYMKLLHRLIFEEFYQTEIPSDWIIHHEDENKLNNEIWNLVPMSKEEHVAIHHKGKTVPFKSRKKISKAHTQSGVLHVAKSKRKDYKRGYIWRYVRKFSDGEKNITATTFLKLKEKVLANGFEWIVLDEEKAKVSELS